MLTGKISKTTIFICIFLIISVFFANQALKFFELKFGKETIRILFNIIALVTFLATSLFLVKNNRSFIKISFSLLILAVALLITLKMKIPSEKIHIMEYGLLGGSAARDLIRNDKKINKIFQAVVFTLAIGILDELVQKALPYRVFDTRDIVFNSLGAVCGISLYLLK